MAKRKQERDPTQHKGKDWSTAKKVGIGFLVMGTGGLAGPALVAMRNRVVGKEEEVGYAWAQVEVELQRRMGLIDRLVDIVKSYAEHEHKVLSDIANARARMAGAIRQDASTDERVGIAGELMGAVSRLLIVIEKYPDLKADGHYQGLRQQLVETEDRIASARNYYNQQVLDYNKALRSWLTSVLAEDLRPHVYFGSPLIEILEGSVVQGEMDND